MACLLASVAADRLRLQMRYSTLYDARSDVVHGRRSGDSSLWRWRLEAGTEKVGLGVVASEALDVAMRGLKAIMERRPDLIPFAAAQRSQRLLLGG
jgi:hypothetical protein